MQKRTSDHDQHSHQMPTEPINIAKIRTNSHELHSETGCWTVPKTPWVERICHLCENMNIEDAQKSITWETIDLLS